MCKDKNVKAGHQVEGSGTSSPAQGKMGGVGEGILIAAFDTGSAVICMQHVEPDAPLWRFITLICAKSRKGRKQRGRKVNDSR